LARRGHLAEHLSFCKRRRGWICILFVFRGTVYLSCILSF
jgi:hypothetical protein